MQELLVNPSVVTGKFDGLARRSDLGPAQQRP